MSMELSLKEYLIAYKSKKIPKKLSTRHDTQATQYQHENSQIKQNFKTTSFMGPRREPILQNFGIGQSMIITPHKRFTTEVDGPSNIDPPKKMGNYIDENRGMRKGLMDRECFKSIIELKKSLAKVDETRRLNSFMESTSEKRKSFQRYEESKNKLKNLMQSMKK